MWLVCYVCVFIQHSPWYYPVLFASGARESYHTYTKNGSVLFERANLFRNSLSSRSDCVQLQVHAIHTHMHRSAPVIEKHIARENSERPVMWLNFSIENFVDQLLSFCCFFFASPAHFARVRVIFPLIAGFVLRANCTLWLLTDNTFYFWDHL